MGLHSFFEERAERVPQNIALHCDDEILTYQNVEQRANQWAHFLQEQGIGVGNLVGVLLDRSVDLYIAILAILKTGAAYVPIDPEYPAERISYILSDANAAALITSSTNAKKIPQPVCAVFHADEMQKKLIHYSIERVTANHFSSENTAYVIYTSGTTGQPKGVAVLHRNVCHYITQALKIYAITEKDRIYQGFSIAFDASIEEIWLALSSGATLVVGVAKALHAGAGLVEFLNLHQVTMFSTVPTMLAMLEGEIASLRLLILGGEVCSKELIARWMRPGLKIINTYGPTETTVIATYKICEPEQNVTIGQPLPGYEILVLNENLQPVAQGEQGELCIGGAGVAFGYINRPDLTAQKFIPHPLKPSERLYRTGDLVYITAENEIQFVGRKDEQIKLRGFRVELAEIETVILQYAGVRNAAVKVHELTAGLPTLVAYLVLKNQNEFNQNEFNHFLRQRLPEYMLPGLIEILSTLPQLPSGKVDRKKLPVPTLHDDRLNKDYVAPTTEIEKNITEAFGGLFKHNNISIKADFFHDLGGHSLAAAKAVSLLRKVPNMECLSMLDIYENPTIEQLAKKVEKIMAQIAAREKKQGTNEPKESIAKKIWRHRLCGIAQIFGCYLHYGIMAWEFLLLYLTVTFVGNRYGNYSLHMIAAIFLLMIVLPVISFFIPIIAKWLIIGKFKPGAYKLWGTYYFRWWLVTHIQKFSPVNFMIGSPFVNLYYRLMGAKIGKNCHVLASSVNCFDLLTLGDNSTVGYHSIVHGAVVENGYLKLGTTTIGERCYVGAQSMLGLNTTMESDSVLEDLSTLPANMTIPAGQYYQGAPAKLKTKPEKYKIHENNLTQNLAGKAKSWLAYYIALFFITVVYYGSFLPGVMLVDYFYEQGRYLKAFLFAAPIAGLTYILVFAFIVISLKWLLIGKVKAGRYKTNSLFYVKYWFVERLLDTKILSAACDSLYFPWFLRLLGAKIGKGVEAGELPHRVPDLLTFQEKSFAASGVFIGLPHIQNGYMTLTPVTIGKQTFIGNNALLPPGTVLGDNCLIGCLSIPPENERASKSNCAWFGSPAVLLPKREVFSQFSDKVKFTPPWWLYLTRLAIESIRILLPSMFAFIGLLGLFFSVDFLWKNFSALTTILAFPLFDFLVMFGLTCVVIALKWILMGKMRETAKPVWSIFIWKYDIIVYLFEGFMRPAVLDPLLGTPFLAYVLKLMGLKIGKRAYINTYEFSELDLIEIGDDVELNTDSLPLTHLYEDRILKMSHIRINDNAHLGVQAVVLYDTLMEKNAALGGLSLLMKGETLPQNSYWEGIPAQFGE